MKVKIPVVLVRELVALLLVMALVLTGCSSDGEDLTEVKMPDGTIDVSESQLNVALVVGSNVRANVERTTQYPSNVEDAFTAALYTGGDVAIITVEGEPRLIPMDGMQSSAVSSDIRLEENEAAVRGILGQVCQGTITATTPEADCSAAIMLAGRMLSGAEAEDTVEIMLIADSMLSTAGPVNFGESGIPIGEVEPDEAVNRLVEASMIPDLGSVDHVYVFYLGDCTLPQQQPSEADRKWLERFWALYFEAAGTSVAFSQTPPASADSVDPQALPEVSAVPLKSETTEELWGDLAEGKVIELSSDGGGAFAFKPDSSDLINEDAARQAADKLAAEICALPSGSVVEVAGHTAGDGDGSELSLKRAERVQSLLIDAGADQSQLVARGYGCENSPSHQHVPDVVDGKLVEEAATQNRLVTLSLVSQ